MVVKFIQINIYKGKYLDALLEFLKSENPDFISMQEVTTGKLNLTGDEQNLFEVIKGELGYHGVYNGDIKLAGSANSSFGNAVISRFPITKSEIVVLKSFRPITLEEMNENIDNIWAQLSRHLLDVTVDCEGFKFHAIAVHARRTAPPVDDEESARQTRLIAGHLKSLGDEPFVLGGDFNMPPESGVIKTIADVSKNLMADSGIAQTLNPKVHELGEHGYLVDYIFTSKHFMLKSLHVPQVTISDHLPVVAVLEYQP